MDEMTIIHGAVAPGPGGGVIYSITLGNGFIVTNPGYFAGDQPHPFPKQRIEVPPVPVLPDPAVPPAK